MHTIYIYIYILYSYYKHIFLNRVYIYSSMFVIPAPLIYIYIYNIYIYIYIYIYRNTGLCIHGYVSNLNSIYLIQKKILKIIVNKLNDFSTVSLFKDNKILSLYDICKYNTCIYMYKIFNKLCHPIILNHFTLTSKKRFNTRSNCDFFNLILNIIK